MLFLEGVSALLLLPYQMRHFRAVNILGRTRVTREMSEPVKPTSAVFPSYGINFTSEKKFAYKEKEGRGWRFSPSLGIFNILQSLETKLHSLP